MLQHHLRLVHHLRDAHERVISLQVGLGLHQGTGITKSRAEVVLPAKIRLKEGGTHGEEKTPLKYSGASILENTAATRPDSQTFNCLRYDLVSLL